MKSIISDIKDLYPSSPFILMTPPPTAHNFKPEVKFEYRKVMMRVAQETGQTVLDTWPLFFSNASSDFEFKRDYNATVMDAYLEDGIHFNANGNNAIFKGLLDVILRYYPHLNPWK